MGAWVGGWVDEWVSEWLIDWQIESHRVSERRWAGGWMGDFVSVWVGEWEWLACVKDNKIFIASHCFPPIPLYPGTSDPCLSSSYNVQSFPSLNPCGGYTCATDPVNSSTNICYCKSPFVQVTNVDGSRTCAYGKWTTWKLAEYVTHALVMRSLRAYGLGNSRYSSWYGVLYDIHKLTDVKECEYLSIMRMFSPDLVMMIQH